MSDGNSAELLWRETYFILFPQDNRPTLKRVATALGQADKRLVLENLAADDKGLFTSLLVESPEDHAAVEISYEVGEAVIEQNLEWAKQLQHEVSSEQLQQIIRSDARLDVAHFELKAARKSDSHASSFSVAEGFSADYLDEDLPDEEEAEFEMLDPTCLLTVVEALATLTQGIAFDPASGEIMP
jgi:hypothetical protein